MGPGRQGRDLVPDRGHGARPANLPVDRILEAEPTGQPAARPDDFTLASAWEQVVGEVEQRRSRTWATALIDARFVPILRDHFGRHCHTDGQLADGRARVRIAAPTPLDIARNLAGWGAMIEVIEPRTVQAELARIGASSPVNTARPTAGPLTSARASRERPIDRPMTT